VLTEPEGDLPINAIYMGRGFKAPSYSTLLKRSITNIWSVVRSQTGHGARCVRRRMFSRGLTYLHTL